MRGVLSLCVEIKKKAKFIRFDVLYSVNVKGKSGVNLLHFDNGCDCYYDGSLIRQGMKAEEFCAKQALGTANFSSL